MFPISSLNQIGASGGSGTGLLDDVSTRSLKTATLGQNAGKLSTGTANAFVGYEAGRANKAGSYDTFIGYQAGSENSSASFCTFIGALAGRQNQRGIGSVFVGYSAGEFNADGVECVGIGAYAMRENISGNRCVAIGYRAAERMLNGDFNTMVGAESGQDNRSGNYNTAIGYRSGRALFRGDENTFTGAFAGYSNALGSGNAFVGYGAGRANQGNKNTIVGANAGTFVEGNTNVIVGSSSALYLQGDASVVVGTESALNLRYGSSNVFLGSGANSFFASNTHSICIGTRNARAMSYGIVLGEDIETRRQGTVSLGFNIQSDADNSILLGNDLNINSVINFNNVLQFNLRNISFEDGLFKFGISNIEYSNFLQLGTDFAPFVVAQSGAYTSNLLSSLTQKMRGTLSPDSYDLRQVMPSYVLYNGVGVGIFSDLNETFSIFHRSNLATKSQLLASSNVEDSLNIEMSPSNILFQDALLQSSFSADLTYGRSDVVTNVLLYDTSSAVVPITIVKSVARPILAHSNTHVTANSLSNVVLQDLHTSNINLTFESFGLSSNVFNLDNVSMRTYVTRGPSYGVVGPLIFHPSNVSTLTYMPYYQFAFQPSDRFSLTPSLNITDANGVPFSLMTDSNLDIIVDRSSNTMHTTPLYSFSNLGAKLRRQNIQQIPSPISRDTPLEITSIPSNTYVIHEISGNRNVYSSNDISLMVRERIIEYTDAVKEPLLFSIQDNINSLRSNLASSRSNILYPISKNIQSNVYALSNIVEELAPIPLRPNIKQDYRQVVDRYKVVETPSILQRSVDVLTIGFSNNWILFNSNVNLWMSIYDPNRVTYAPPSFNITSNSDLFNKTLFVEKRWSIEKELGDSYSNLSLASARQDSLRTSSNAIMNDVKLFPSIFENDTISVSGALSEYNTWFRKYYELPRLFTAYSDVLGETLQLQTHSSTAFEDHIDIRLIQPIRIPYVHYPFSSQWMMSLNSNIVIDAKLSTHASGGVILPSVKLPSLMTSNIFIKEYPIYGTLLSTTSNVYSSNMQQVSLA
jgi:hypothetical protein